MSENHPETNFLPENSPLGVPTLIEDSSGYSSAYSPITFGNTRRFFSPNTPLTVEIGQSAHSRNVFHEDTMFPLSMEDISTEETPTTDANPHQDNATAEPNSPRRSGLRLHSPISNNFFRPISQHASIYRTSSPVAVRTSRSHHPASSWQPPNIHNVSSQRTISTQTAVPVWRPNSAPLYENMFEVDEETNGCEFEGPSTRPDSGRTNPPALSVSPNISSPMPDVVQTLPLEMRRRANTMPTLTQRMELRSIGRRLREVGDSFEGEIGAPERRSSFYQLLSSSAGDNRHAFTPDHHQQQVSLVRRLSIPVLNSVGQARSFILTHLTRYLGLSNHGTPTSVDLLQTSTRAGQQHRRPFSTSEHRSLFFSLDDECDETVDDDILLDTSAMEDPFYEDDDEEMMEATCGFF